MLLQSQHRLFVYPKKCWAFSFSVPELFLLQWPSRNLCKIHLFSWSTKSSLTNRQFHLKQQDSNPRYLAMNGYLHTYIHIMCVTPAIRITVHTNSICVHVDWCFLVVTASKRLHVNCIDTYIHPNVHYVQLYVHFADLDQYEWYSLSIGLFECSVLACNCECAGLSLFTSDLLKCKVLSLCQFYFLSE